VAIWKCWVEVNYNTTRRREILRNITARGAYIDSPWAKGEHKVGRRSTRVAGNWFFVPWIFIFIFITCQIVLQGTTSTSRLPSSPRLRVPSACNPCYTGYQGDTLGSPSRAKWMHNRVAQMCAPPQSNRRGKRKFLFLPHWTILPVLCQILPQIVLTNNRHALRLTNCNANNCTLQIPYLATSGHELLSDDHKTLQLKRFIDREQNTEPSGLPHSLLCANTLSRRFSI